MAGRYQKNLAAHARLRTATNINHCQTKIRAWWLDCEERQTRSYIAYRLYQKFSRPRASDQNLGMVA